MKRLIALVLSIAMLLTMTATFACAESSVAVKKLTLSQATETLLIGGDSSLGQAALTAQVEPENADCQTVQWSSSNEKVATVDAEGHIQG
ncbi:MAG: Ig-like domain-containing protein, partial [Clostridia bacterium]